MFLAWAFESQAKLTSSFSHKSTHFSGLRVQCIIRPRVQTNVSIFQVLRVACIIRLKVNTNASTFRVLRVQCIIRARDVLC